MLMHVLCRISKENSCNFERKTDLLGDTYTSDM